MCVRERESGRDQQLKYLIYFFCLLPTSMTSFTTFSDSLHLVFFFVCCCFLVSCVSENLIQGMYELPCLMQTHTHALLLSCTHTLTSVYMVAVIEIFC